MQSAAFGYYQLHCTVTCDADFRSRYPPQTGKRVIATDALCDA